MAIAFPHVPARAQSWAGVDTDLHAFVESVVAAVAAAVDAVGLAGAYLHGSLAMGSYYRPKSDLDLLFVVDGPLPAPTRRDVAHILCDLSDARPTTGDLEASVIRRDRAVHFTHPLPFEVHYGSEWKHRIRADGVDHAAERKDPDLAAHFATARARGVVLRGVPIAEAFGPVPVEAVRDSILDDLAWILDDGNLAESPFYGVLNCCRVLALEAEGWDRVWSKDEGGEWALVHVPERHRPLITQALACYRSSERVDEAERRTDGHAWIRAALDAFRDFVRAR